MFGVRTAGPSVSATLRPVASSACWVMEEMTATPPSALSLVAVTLNFGAYGSAEQLVTASGAQWS